MAKKRIPLAIAYDFDGTLAPGNMQEHAFIPEIGMSSKAFWGRVTELSREHDADQILIYMGFMLQRAQAAQVPVHKSDFEAYGRDLPLFQGVSEWFSRINTYAKEGGVRADHFIVSSGIREMIEGTSLSQYFKAVFASSFWYDHNGVAQWPALALNYTTKTQYLFRINKGSLNVYDHTKINEFVPDDQRPIPFTNMVYIGDGETDIPCFRLVKDLGGHSVAVYKPRSKKGKRTSEKLLKDGRVNFVCRADYREGTELDRIIKGIIDKLAVDENLVRLGKQSRVR